LAHIKERKLIPTLFHGNHFFKHFPCLHQNKEARNERIGPPNFWGPFDKASHYDYYFSPDNIKPLKPLYISLWLFQRLLHYLHIFIKPQILT